MDAYEIAERDGSAVILAMPDGSDRAVAAEKLRDEDVALVWKVVWADHSSAVADVEMIRMLETMRRNRRVVEA